jgi:NAD(P)-dependent dehydrogenase (short-subunit alcohol dehydrogenase family)
MSRGEEIHQVTEKLNALALQGSRDNEKDLESLIMKSIEQYGRVDVLIKNTGRATKGDLLGVTDYDWENGINLLLMNVIRSSRIITPILQNQGGGNMVNISTFVALASSLGFPIYSVMRSALGSYTKLYVA